MPKVRDVCHSSVVMSSAYYNGCFVKRYQATFIDKPVVTDDVGPKPAKKKTYNASKDEAKEKTAEFFRTMSRHADDNDRVLPQKHLHGVE